MKAFFRILAPLTFVFTIISCSSDSDEAINVTEQQIMNYNYNADETELAGLINEYRASIGLNQLEIINHISYKSGEHNEYMIANNVVDHAYFQERSDNIINVLGAVTVEENVAYNYSTSQSVLNAWLNSPSHKANIEGNHSHFGISVTVNPATGKKYYTNIFMKK